MNVRHVPYNINIVYSDASVLTRSPLVNVHNYLVNHCVKKNINCNWHRQVCVKRINLASAQIFHSPKNTIFISLLSYQECMTQDQHLSQQKTQK